MKAISTSRNKPDLSKEPSEFRSAVMRAVRSTNTMPEMAVRKVVHSLGFRYRLHVEGLPGTPDLVFPSRRKVMFVNGCFWHGHQCKRGRRIPRTNRAYWIQKVASNTARDRRSLRLLRSSGWSCLVVWECEVRSTALAKRLVRFLSNKQGRSSDSKKGKS